MRAQTIDQQFNESYSNSGLQPSYRNQTKVRNINISQTEKNDANYPDDNFYYPNPYNESVIRPNINRVTSKNEINVSNIKSGDVVARLKARGVNTFIRSFFSTAWLFFQIPFAILSIVFLGLTVAIAYLNSLLGTEYDPNNVMDKLDKIKGDAFDSVVNKVLDFAFGIDLSWFDVNNLFFITWTMVFIFGIVNILSIFLIYKITGLNPIIGERGGAFKSGMVILAFIGYLIPILNIVPWFYFWTMAVQKYPK